MFTELNQKYQKILKNLEFSNSIVTKMKIENLFSFQPHISSHSSPSSHIPLMFVVCSSDIVISHVLSHHIANTHFDPFYEKRKKRKKRRKKRKRKKSEVFPQESDQNVEVQSAFHFLHSLSHSHSLSLFLFLSL